jgi:hypothetical protein
MEALIDDKLVIAVEVGKSVYLCNDLDEIPSLLLKQIRPLLHGEVIKIYLHKRVGGLPYPQVEKSD